MFGNSAVAAVAAAGRGENRSENRSENRDKTSAARPVAATRPAPAPPAASDAAEAAPAAGADRAADKADKAGDAKGTKARPGPNADPKFAKLKKDVARKKRTLAASHPPPRTEATAAQDAALPPKDDAEAQGKTANAEEMNEAKPKEFDKDAFIRAVEKAIADKAPKNLDEADKFADSGKADEVRAEVTGKVGEGRSASAEQIATTTAAPPNTAVAVPKKVVPMKADRPPGAPASPNAAQAVPDKLPESATDLSAGPAEVRRRMTGAQVTEAQLRKSNEPKFKKALSEKKTAERHSATAPDKMRGHEKKELKAATARAKRLGTAAMGAMGAQRTLTGKRVDTGKGGAKSRDEGKRAKVTKLLQGVFDTMQKDVQGILDGLDKLVGDQFDRGERAAREAFTAEHKQKMEEYKDRRYSGWRGKARWVKDLFAGLPAEADKIFEKARDNYVQRMRQVISDVADTIGAQLNKAKRRIAQGRKEMQDAVQRLPADLRSIGRQAAAEFTDKFDELTQSVDDKGTELVDTLATKYTDALKSVDDEIAAEKEKNKGLVAKAVDAVKGVINTIMELKKLLLSVLAKAAQAVMLILKDPIGFLKNLVTAVGGGLKLFLKNIGRHLQQGIMSWLLGRTAEAGIQLPAKFDTRGIVTMLASLLGLTWQNIRARILRKVPKMEPAVAAAETAIPLVAEVRKRGVAGMWNDLKTRLGDMKKELLDKVIAYVTPTIVQAGIMWILSLLNPASAFVRAVKLIIDVVRFIVTQARQIFEFVNAVLDAVIAIARGGTGGVPALIERALARSIPVLLGFLASLLGIGGVVSKVKQIVQALSKPVNRAVDWVIDKIVGLVKKLWAKIKSKFEKKKPKKPRDIGKSTAKKKGPGRKPHVNDRGSKKTKKSPADNKNEIGPVGKDLKWTAVNESHHLWIAKVGRRHVPMIASNPHPVDQAIENYRTQASKLDPNDKNIINAIDNTEGDLNALKSAIAQYEEKVKNGAAGSVIDSKEEAIESAEVALQNSVTKVQKLLGYDQDQRLDRARKKFKSNPFTTAALGKFLGIGDRTAQTVVKDWKEKGAIFRIESSQTDSLGANTFDPAAAKIREVNPDNRKKYGYVNPKKTSAEGLEILSKGLLGIPKPKGGWIHATPSQKTDTTYHQQHAHYESVVNPTSYPDFLFPKAILGHGPEGASEHWNRIGHTQTREENLKWNQTTSNYHGPEHENESSASGSKAPRYRVPTVGESHESWLKES